MYEIQVLLGPDWQGGSTILKPSILSVGFSDTIIAECGMFSVTTYFFGRIFNDPKSYRTVVLVSSEMSSGVQRSILFAENFLDLTQVNTLPKCKLRCHCQAHRVT